MVSSNLNDLVIIDILSIAELIISLRDRNNHI